MSFLIWPLYWSLFNVYKHLVSILVIKWRNSNYHLIANKNFTNILFTLRYREPTSLVCDHALSLKAFQEIYTLVSHKMNSTQEQVLPNQNQPVLYNHFHQLVYFQASNLDIGFCLNADNLMPMLSKLYKT